MGRRKEGSAAAALRGLAHNPVLSPFIAHSIYLCHPARMRFVLIGLVFLLPVPLLADVVSDVHIAPDGSFTAKNLTVVQVAGMNVFARATWGQAFVRTTILVQASTVITKAHGEKAEARDIKKGDILDVEGMLVSGADSIMLKPTRIRDVSLQQTERTIQGTILAIDKNAFSLRISSKGATTTILLSASTPIKKGARSIDFADLTNGETVTAAPGIYDYRTNTVRATTVEIYQDQKLFIPRAFEGVLRSASSTTLPAQITLDSDGTTYTVFLPADASVLSKSRTKALFSRVQPGDRVRVWGTIRAANVHEIDADTLRDLDF